MIIPLLGMGDMLLDTVLNPGLVRSKEGLKMPPFVLLTEMDKRRLCLQDGT